MNLIELSEYFNNFLHLENFKQDISLNGLQIQNSSPELKEIKKVAFAVDACEESAKKAAQAKAQLLFVHHGIFWGHQEPVTGALYKKISVFLKNDLALYACHAPLDSNIPYGNNYCLAQRINLIDTEPFGSWKGMTLGIKGHLKTPVTIEELSKKILQKNEKPLHVMSFGKKLISTVGIISGAGGDDVNQAVQENLDAFITGEVGHASYHFIKESAINVIAAGHYQTETIGIQNIMEKLSNETGIETFFIDIPTNM